MSDQPMTPKAIRLAAEAENEPWKAEIRKHGGLVHCAWVALRGQPDQPETDEDSRNVDLCVARIFDGDWGAFETWAEEYLAFGCGIAG